MLRLIGEIINRQAMILIYRQDLAEWGHDPRDIDPWEVIEGAGALDLADYYCVLEALIARAECYDIGLDTGTDPGV